MSKEIFIGVVGDLMEVLIFTNIDFTTFDTDLSCTGNVIANYAISDLSVILSACLLANWPIKP